MLAANASSSTEKPRLSSLTLMVCAMRAPTGASVTLARDTISNAGTYR